tara:strand:- start:548 stop:958 length:411 start_codon:yes stop_codon:yes gene_type:complete
MRKVALEQNVRDCTFFINQYDNLKFDALIEKMESIIFDKERKPFTPSEGENHLILLFEEMIPEIFPSILDGDDEDAELAIEKLYEEIGIDITYFVPRKMVHLINNDLEREKQILLYCYRLREALYVNWKHLQEREV